MSWKLPIGAQPHADGTTFRVWAPVAKSVEVVLTETGQHYTLNPEPDGYFSRDIPGVTPGTRYAYRIDHAALRPDPASRAQPRGVHGPSMIVDPGAFAWSDHHWHGLAIEDLIIYELHVGAATPAGTFEALIEQLDHLVELGVTAIELMPVAEFPGERNWGYDGVNLFAPTHSYGGAQGLYRLVDAAHARGLAVLLDVVYNHLGPDGNYLREFSPYYFTDQHTTPWGDAIDVDGLHARPVRDFFIANALYWAHEYHIDGLRLDAVHAIIDTSPTHLIAELASTLRSSLPPERQFLLIAEHDANDPMVIRRPDPTLARAAWGLDGIWSDDFHHQVRVALTGERDGYYADYSGTAQDLAATISQNWFFHGQLSPHLGRVRGVPAADLAPAHFIYCIQNHDQVGNRALGDRLNHVIPLDAYRAASALLILIPQTPLLWMGQEWAASTPFLFFTDHNPELGRAVTEGRRREFARFTAFSKQVIPDPQALETFTQTKLRWEERSQGEHASVLLLYQDLLSLRRSHPMLRQRTHCATRAIGDRTISLHYHGPGSTELLVIVSLGGVTKFDLMTTGRSDWRLLLDSESSTYGGRDTPPIHGTQLHLDGARAVILVR